MYDVSNSAGDKMVVNFLPLKVNGEWISSITPTSDGKMGADNRSHAVREIWHDRNRHGSHQSIRRGENTR